MKTLNQRLYEEVLEPMFPGEFIFGECENSGEMVIGTFFTIFCEDSVADGKQPYRFIEDAFWLADKVGLFKAHDLIQRKDGKYSIRKEESVTGFDFRYVPIALGKTPQEAIVNAILEIYGKKE